eukprot:759490-Hanusia_phi.AAC.2
MDRWGAMIERQQQKIHLQGEGGVGAGEPRRVGAQCKPTTSAGREGVVPKRRTQGYSKAKGLGYCHADEKHYRCRDVSVKRRGVVTRGVKRAT